MEYALGNLSNDAGNGNEHVTWKYNFALLLLLRDYSNSFNLYNMGEVFWNSIDKNAVQVTKKNEKFTVVCSRFVLHKTFNMVISRCGFADDGKKKMYQSI